MTVDSPLLTPAQHFADKKSTYNYTIVIDAAKTKEGG